MAKETHLEMLNARRPYFFEPFQPNSSSERLKIPFKFIKHLGGTTSGSVSLTGPSGKTWHVDLIQQNDSLYFHDGWPEFVRDHFIECGDALVFRYDGNFQFTVQVFDQSACEKEAAFHAECTQNSSNIDKSMRKKREREKEAASPDICFEGVPKKMRGSSSHLHLECLNKNRGMILHVSMNLQSSAQDENQFFYNGFHGALLHLDGNAKIHPNGLLQLTNFSKHVTHGHAFYQFPLKFKTSSSNFSSSLSFSTNFIFAMVPELLNFSANGIAFVISPSMDFSTALASQYLGLFNASNNGLSSNHVFAIELDTILNTEFGDVDDNHVGIDVNSLRSIKSAPAAFYSDEEGKNESLKLSSGNSMQLWIDYDGVEKQINVTLAPIGRPKPNRPLLSTAIDLSSILLENMYVGFSAATGSIVSNHYILGWSFNKSGQAQSLEFSKLPSFPRQRKSGNNQGLIIMILLIVTISVLVIAIAIAAYIMRRKKYKEIREDWEEEYGPQRFSYKDLYTATKGFKDTELLGAGGFGKVYRGVLPSSHREVAIKKVSHDSNQGLKEFFTEIASMGRLRHRNLVQLLGYCRRKGELLLVYDYMPNGSLDKFLFSNKKPNLTWFQRYRILRGVASGLLYLHEYWEQVVLHRDVKAGNVLLDADLNGRLGDFGLARLYDHGTNPQTTHVVGTVGYLAPDLTRNGKATTSTDVFAFGVFMLEVACGRRPVELQGLPEQTFLVDWVLECWKKGAILEAVDPRLYDEYVAEEMELVLKLGLLCSHSMPAGRPSMRQVTQYLDGDAILPEIPPDSVGIAMSSTSDEAFNEFITSFPSSFGKASAHSLSSTDSILCVGR